MRDTHKLCRFCEKLSGSFSVIKNCLVFTKINKIKVSSIVNWGCRGSFKSVYFFTKRNSKPQTPNKRLSPPPPTPVRSFQAHKPPPPPPLEVFERIKNVVFAVFCSLIFVLLVGFCLWAFLTLKIFSLKKINRFEIVPIASIHHTTKVDLFLKGIFFESEQQFVFFNCFMY